MSTDDYYWCPPRFIGPARPVKVNRYQMQTAQMLARGQTNAQIALKMDRSFDTVKGYVGQLLTVTKARDRTQLVAKLHSREIVLVSPTVT